MVEYAQVLEEMVYDNTGALASRKTCTIGDDVITEAQWLSTTQQTTVRHLLCDGRGSVRQHADNSGNLIAYDYLDGSQQWQTCDTFSYDGYGRRVDPLGDTVNRGLFYTGEQWDTAARQYYLRARYYDPLTGRFNRLDPFTCASHAHNYECARDKNVARKTRNVIMPSSQM